MTADSYVLVFVLGPDLGFVFVIGAIPLAIYGLCTRIPRRGLIASRIALLLSLLAVLVSTLLWFVLLSGDLRYGQPVDYGDPFMRVYEAIAILEALALFISIVSAVRQRARRTS